MPVFIDQMKRTIEVPDTPKRIISIVPSQTELVFELGLDNEIIGITKFCIHPSDKIKQKVKVGGTKTLNINQIKKLNPGLIIGNKEENERSQVEELMNLFPVWMSDITNLGDALQMIRQVGELTGKNAEAGRLTKSILSNFDGLHEITTHSRVAYLIWRKPFIIAGKGTFIDDMLKRCGMSNVFELERYPEVFPAQLMEANPDVVLLSSEPYPFQQRHIAEFKALLPNTIVKLVDGEIFSWYGSRLLQAPKYFNMLIDSLNQ